MSDLERAFDDFTAANEQALTRMAEQLAGMRALVAELQTQLRATPTVLPAIAEPGPRGENGKDGEDAIGIGGVSIRGVDLIIRLTDGTEHNVGRVVGQDGSPGPTGPSGESIVGPAGPPGIQGERGADGIATREELGALIEARAADFRFNSIVDTHKGVWRSGEIYQRGDVTVLNGSTWVATLETRAAPGAGPDWKIVAKAGRDGRDRTDRR